MEQEIKIRVNSRLLRAVAEIAALRNMSVPNYLIELLEQDRAEIIRLRIRKEQVLGPEPTELLPQWNGVHKLSAGQVQRILHLAVTVAPADIAARVGCSVGTVRRVLAARDNSPRRTQITIRPTTCHGESLPFCLRLK